MSSTRSPPAGSCPSLLFRPARSRRCWSLGTSALYLHLSRMMACRLSDKVCMQRRTLCGSQALCFGTLIRHGGGCSALSAQRARRCAACACRPRDILLVVALCILTSTFISSFVALASLIAVCACLTDRDVCLTCHLVGSRSAPQCPIISSLLGVSSLHQ